MLSKTIAGLSERVKDQSSGGEGSGGDLSVPRRT